jgi:hypothetical protein
MKLFLNNPCVNKCVRDYVCAGTFIHVLFIGPIPAIRENLKELTINEHED